MNPNTTLIGLLLLLLIGPSLKAQGYVDILPDEVKTPFIERYGLIAKELEKTVENEWAGTYSRYVAPTWSDYLFWSTKNGFAAFRDTCSNGPRAWVNYGTASFRDGLLVVVPERGDTAEFVLKLPETEYTPIKWGKQHWLIPTDKLTLFAYAVNSGSPDEYGRFYSKINEPENDGKVRPELPLQYKRLLGLPPIKAKVTEIGRQAEVWDKELTIDAGKNKGVIEGMGFWLIGVKNIDVKVVVEEVRDQTSRVRIASVGIWGDKQIEVVPKRGWRFASRYKGD